MQNLIHATKVFILIIVALLLVGATFSTPMPYTPFTALLTWGIIHVLGKKVFKVLK